LVNGLIIAEKPLLAAAILDALPGSKKALTSSHGTTYYEKNGYTVTNAVGHILSLKDPEDYDPKYKEWKLEDLPIFFDNWGLKPAKDKENIVKTIGELLKAAPMVIHAGDIDDEGQLLIDEILWYFDYKGPVMRLRTNDIEPSALRRELASMQDNSKVAINGISAHARRIADKMVGFNYSRYYSILGNTTLSCGRVQTPGLGLVVTRDTLIENHIKVKYYGLIVDVSINGFNGYITTDFVPAKDCDMLNEDGHFIHFEPLTKFLAAIKGKTYKSEVTSKIENRLPPLPFNQNKLQLFCSKEFGFDPKKVTAITQELRDRYKAITYNRSTCQYMTDEQYKTAPASIAAALKNCGLDAASLGINSSIKPRCYDDAKVGDSAHTAIIPTAATFDINLLTPDEKKVYTAICNQFLIQFMPPCVIHRVRLNMPLGKGHSLTATTSNVTSLGYCTLVDDSPKETPTALYNIPEGEYTATVIDGRIKESETKPPARYTKATLAADMSRVAQYVSDPQIKKLLLAKDKGVDGENGSIGTGATRPDIIDSLERRGYIETIKGGKIISTQKGRDFFALLPDSIKKPDLTAKWWAIQENIKEGTQTPEDLFADVLVEFKKLMQQPPPQALIELKEKTAAVNSKYKVVGTCPRCGSPIIETPKAFGCSGYKSGCTFVIWKEGKYGAHKVLAYSKKKLTEKMATDLLKNGKTFVKKLVSEKTGKEYDAYITLNDTGNGVFLNLDFSTPKPTSAKKPRKKKLG